MTDFSIHQTAASQVQGQSVGGLPSGAASETGKLAGFQVQVADDPFSALADSAEELTFGVDNTKEFALKERKTKETSGGAIERVKLYQEIMEESWKQKDAERLHAFLKNNRSAQAALDKAREWASGDSSNAAEPSETWAILKKMGEELRGDALEAVREALAQLEKEAGPEIRAGILGTVEGASHPALDALGDAAGQGASYRRAVCELYDKPETMFDFILEKYGMENFETGLDFLFRSLASDLASDEPSHGQTHLEAVGQSLGQARILNSAHTLAGKLIDRWENAHGVKDCGLTAMGMLKELLCLKQNHYLSAASLAPLLQSARAPDIEREVLFAQELLATARNFSPLFFDGLENRMKFIDAVQEAVDNAVAREDEWLASQG